jgi:hypothetical protein
MTQPKSHPVQALRRAAPFVSGMMIGTSMIAPVFAATAITADQLQPLMLVGSGVLLVGALTLKAMAGRQGRNARKRSVNAQSAQAIAVSDMAGLSPQRTGTIGDFRISRPWNR